MGEYNQAVRLWREEEESDSEGEGDLATDMEHQIHLIKRAHRKMRVYMYYLRIVAFFLTYICYLVRLAVISAVFFLSG